jgi:hypothetical protein
VLSDGQVNEFAERGFVLVPQVVPGDALARAARRIDEVVAADPPAADKRWPGPGRWTSPGRSRSR